MILEAKKENIELRTGNFELDVAETFRFPLPCLSV